MIDALQTPVQRRAPAVSRGKIGIVTVTYNSEQVIQGFLKSLLAQSYSDFTLYVIDNASSDQTRMRINLFEDSRISLIANGDNRGFAQGSNQGIRAALDAGCSWVLLINNDTEFEPWLLNDLLAGLEESSADMVAPKILLCERPDVIWSAGGGVNPMRGYTGFHHGQGEIDRGQFNTSRIVEHAPACCLLIRKEVFAEIGLLDEHYFVYIEDTDFCYRARLAGLRLLYLPSTRLFHKASSLTGGAQSDFTVRYLTRNQIYFLLKHFGFWRSLYYIPAFQVYQLSRLLSRKIDASGFFLRQRALAEGFDLWRRSRPQ